jgi:nucleoside-diphosphate-sugar epimerase
VREQTGPVLVTGGAGFIGVYLTRRLKEVGLDVRILDTRLPGERERFILGPHADSVVAGAIEASVGDREAVEAAVAAVRPRHIVHVGAIGSPIPLARDPRLALEVNVLGTVNVLEAARASGVERVIAFSSIGVLPAARYEPIDADHPTLTAGEASGTGFYGASKIAAEAFSVAYADAFDLDVRIIRPSAVYGFGMNFPLHVRPIVEGVARGERVVIESGGSLARDHTHVEDVIGLTIALMRADDPADRVFYAATGGPLTDGFEIARIVRELVPGADIEVNGDLGAEDRLQASRRGRLSIKSAEEQLGWRPQVSLRDGLSGYLEEQHKFELRVRGQAAGASHP